MTPTGHALLVAALLCNPVGVHVPSGARLLDNAEQHVGVERALVHDDGAVGKPKSA